MAVAVGLAVAVVLGDLCRVHGQNMVQLTQDAIGVLIKLTRDSALPLRLAACGAVGAALDGSGGIDEKVQSELLKNLKAVLGERSVPREIKVACLRALPPFVRNAEGLWHGEVLDKFPVAQHILFGDIFAASWLSAADAVRLCVCAFVRLCVRACVRAFVREWAN